MGCATAPVVLNPSHEEPELVSSRHLVEAGETLTRIAKAYGISVEDLAAVNGLTLSEPLAVGRELVIPGPPAEAHRVSVPESSGATGAPRSERAPPRAPVGPAVRALGTGTGALRWPLRGVLYARFGKKGKEPHDGIDLAAPLGTPVKTAAEGSVLFAGEQKGYGLLVIVEHAGGWVTLYAHNRDLRVKAGQKVRVDQVIATVGESGKTSGPHLHFEVRKAGVPIDPLEQLGPVPPS